MEVPVQGIEFEGVLRKSSASLEPSYVLRALGRSDALAHTSIRFGIHRFTTKEQVLKAADIVIKVCSQREV